MSKRNHILVVFLALIAACTDPLVSEDAPHNGGSISTDVVDKPGFTVKGMVFADGMPLPGVIVSDGANVTMTDFDGKYWLRSTYSEDVVWVSLPSGYEPEVKNGWEPRFWYRLDQSMLASGKTQRFDFHLKEVNQDRFRLIAYADAHVRGMIPSYGRKEMDSLVFRKHFQPLLMSLKKSDVRTYAVSLGDMIMESSVTAYSTGLPEYRKCLRGTDFPVFHVPGNHDYEGIQYKKYDTEEARESKQYYIDNFGPTYYSFNIGNNHFVMLDGTQMTGGGQNVYLSRVTKRQYEWLKKDLSRVEDKAGKALVICCHQPFYMYATATAQGVGSLKKANRDSLMALTAEFPKVTILSGHQHYSDIYNFSNGATEVSQYTVPAASGVGYRSRQCIDGSLCGAAVFDFKGTEYSREMAAYDPEWEGYARFYTEGVFTAENPDIGCYIVNIPSYEKGWSVMVLENGIKVKDASRVIRTDPGYEKEWADNGYSNTSSVKPIANSHMFEYVPSNRSATIRMIVKRENETVAEKTIEN